jgi:GT2 family glycosyltransferase
VNESQAPHHLDSPEGRRTRLTVIIVNHESWSDVLQLTASLAAQPEFATGVARVVVVDNASREPAPDGDWFREPGLQLVARPENGGFAAGVNAGWKRAQSPWLLILNPDVEVASGFLSQVVARLELYEADRHGPPGIVGFGLRNPDASPQGSVGAFPNLVRTVWEQFIPRSRRKYQAAWRIRAGPVDWVTGACMLVNESMMNALGGMDEDFFLYYEEVALCRAARRLGWRVEYDARVSVVHRHPLQNRPISPKMRVITRHSKLLYFLKHLPRWQFVSLAGIVRLESAVHGFRSRLQGRAEEARAWQLIGEVARRLRRGQGPRGREVLTLAESVRAPESQRAREPVVGPAAARPETTHTRTSQVGSARTHRGARPLGTTLGESRKDGPV